jgi:hypothetical protein
MADLTLVAPADGIVAQISDRPGEYVPGAGGSSGSPGFIVLIDVPDLQVVADFDQAAAIRLREGQVATVSLAGLPGVQEPAHVTEVDASPTPAGIGTGTSHHVTLTLDHPDAAPKPGMQAAVSVIIARRDVVIAVPNLAVRGSGDTGTVTLLRRGQEVDIDVSLGLRGDMSTEIVSGVGPGEKSGAAFPSTAVIDVTARQPRTGNNHGAGTLNLDVPERSTSEWQWSRRRSRKSSNCGSPNSATRCPSRRRRCRTSCSTCGVCCRTGRPGLTWSDG